MAVHKQSMEISDLNDVVTLELVQHQKVKLQLETDPELQSITAELFTPECQSDLPCTRLEHNVLHTDGQSFLSISVHPADQDSTKIYVAWMLALVVLVTLFIWVFRKWTKRKWVTVVSEEDDNASSTKQLTTTSKPMIKCHKCRLEQKLSLTTIYSNQTNGDQEEVCQESKLTNQNSCYKIPEPRCSNCAAMTQHCNKSMRSSPFPPWWLLFTLLTAVLVTVALVTMGGVRQQTTVDISLLKLTIPQSTHIRHIRSYSEDPSIKDIQFGDDPSVALVTKLQLLDLSADCRNNRTKCRTHALCDTDRFHGDVQCRCNRGYYLQDLECVPCTTSCRDGWYMTQQCSAEQDVICRPCTQCEGTSYQVATCTSTQDTLCIDVTFPLKQYQSKLTSAEELISLNVSMSKNVFLEELQRIKKLETSLYVSNNRQEMQFVWRRPSGLEVKVKVSDIYLIPEYIDLDHQDDSSFVKQNRFPQDTKDQIDTVTKYHCRHPLPDEYDLIMIIDRNASARATEITCDSKNRNVPSCPTGYQDGEKYVAEFLHETCPRLNREAGTKFSQHSNNILCSGNTDVLRDVFKMRADKTRHMTFPSSECQGYRHNCNNCLQRQACIHGSNATDCCNLGCHGQSACQRYYSNTCPVSPVECIVGDLTKFTISPRYPSLQRSFSCHLRYEPPTHLYILEYETSIPSMHFTLGARVKEIKYKNLTDNQNGTEKVDFLIMNHNTESRYSDEVILSGTFNQTNNRKDDSVKEYTLHKLKELGDFDRSIPYSINPEPPRRYKTKVQFTKPFLYTTSSWQKERRCEDNVSTIVPPQQIYKPFGLSVKKPDKRMKLGRFVYQLQSHGAQPRIHFSLENTSVLSYYKEDFKSARINPGSLKGQMVWNSGKHVWTITITGSTSACPGYFTMEIFSENTATRLALYDMLVTCPQNFSVIFNVRRESVQFADKFISVVNDTVASYKIVISSVQSPQYFKTVDTTPVAMETFQSSPWVPIIVIIVICLIISTFLFIVYLYCDKQNYKHIPMDITVPKPDLGAQITLLKNMDAPKKHVGLPAKTKCIMCTLVVLYVCYAFLFTFLALFGMLHLAQGGSLNNITQASNTSAKFQLQMQNKLEQMITYERKETARLLNATRQRLKACSNHMTSSLHKKVPSISEQMERKLMMIFQSNGTVRQLLAKYFMERKDVYQMEINNFIEEYNETVNTVFHKLQPSYSAYLKRVANNQWFSFPRKVYLQQQGLLELEENLAGFLTWLEIDKVQEIIDIKEILMKRFLVMIPKLDFSKLLNDSDDENKMATVNLTMNFSENWFKFTSAPVPGYGDKDISEKLSFHQRNRNIFNSTSNSKNVTSIKGMVYPVFVTVFFILDFLLLFYRISWLRKILKVFKTGLEQRVPYDSITRKVYFILTGRDVPRLEDSLDHPYDYYMDNKENIWGDNRELYFMYCNSSPKSKEEILKDLFAHKQQQKPKMEDNPKNNNSLSQILLKISKLTYKFLISPVFWRIVIICGFVLFVCLVTKATDNLVTMESAVFLMDTESMLPILSRQHGITNNMISGYGHYLNDFLTSYKHVIDGEMQMLNTMMLHVAERQSVLLTTMISELCNLAGGDVCQDMAPGGQDLATLALTSCNFIPLQTNPYTAFSRDILSEFINTELSPLVLNLRSIIFSALYLLLTFAAAMMICQILARVIFVHLRKSRHLRTTKVYQLPSTYNQWDETQAFQGEKEIYNSQSVIAESCESGVYDMTS